MRFRQRFFRLAGINVLSNLMVPLAGLVDTAFLGHLPEIESLAGVALATVIFNVVYWSFGFLRMGTTGTTAQALGRGDTDGVWLLLGRNGLMALGLGLVLLGLQQPIRQVGFSLLQAEPGVMTAGQAFFDARIWDAPALLVNLVILGWFLGRGQGRQVMILAAVSNGGNVLLDYGFIYGLGWGSAGAGAATALSQYLMLLTGVGMILAMGGAGQGRRLWRQLGRGADFSSLLRLNRDIMIRTFALVISFGLFTQISASLGTQVLAANTLLLQVITLSAYFIDGIAFATESFAGQFYGGGQERQLQQLLRLAGGSSVALGLGVASVFVLFPAPLFGQLTSHQTVIEQIYPYRGWLLPILGFGGMAYMLDGYFLGLTAGPTLRNSTLVATGVGFLPIAIAAQLTAQPQLLWLALTGMMALRAVTLSGAVPATLRLDAQRLDAQQLDAQQLEAQQSEPPPLPPPVTSDADGDSCT